MKNEPEPGPIMDELQKLRQEKAELIELIKRTEKAYQLARNAAAGLTNYCEESASVRGCEKELEQSEYMYREIKDALERMEGGINDR